MKKVNECGTRSVIDISGNEDFLYIAYHSMFSTPIRNLDFSNGAVDLNDMDEFLESIVPTYRIGQITVPELELLSCLVYGIALKHIHARGRRNFPNFISEVSVAYQDICKLSLWVKGLFSDHATCLFNVASSGEVTLIYKKPINAGRVYKFTGISITPSKFNFKAFSEFCSITFAPISNMDVHTAKAMHQLISENVSFVCNLGEARNHNPFRFQVKQGER